LIRLLLNVAMVMIVTNAVMLVMTYVDGTSFVFSPLFGLVTPILCGTVSWKVQRKIAEEQ